MSTPANKAAYLEVAEGPFVVRDAPYEKPGPGEVVVKNGAVALNPMDWMIQDMGTKIPFPKSYPAVIGTDVAGEVYEIGEGVTGFEKGDRVIGKANWFRTARNQDGAFQYYSTTEASILAKLPANVPFTAACVLPLAISTSAMGLYPAKGLGLPLPQPGAKPKSAGKVILIWGGASSCGSAAIQLAVASGVTVVSTASRKNFGFVKGLGATSVFDYHDGNVKEKLIEAIKSTGGEFAGALDAVGWLAGEHVAWKVCAEITKALGGGKVATNNARVEVKDVLEGVELCPVQDTAMLSQNKEICDAVWGTYVPQGLEIGTLKPAPEPIVVGKGLEKVQEGCEIGRKGVSAGKLVFEL